MNLSYQLEALHARHVNIRDQAIDLWQTSAIQECRARCKQPYGIVRGLQEVLKRPQNAHVVIDHRNDGAGPTVVHGVLVVKHRLPFRRILSA
jgi:hypothetical protein